MATLIKQQEMLQQLIHAEKIQATKWFGRFGDVKNQGHEVFRKAFEDLQKNLRVHVEEETELIELSMTCGDRLEAALIVNEMVRLFLASRRAAATGDVAAKLANLAAERSSVQRHLDAMELALKDVRDRSGFTDLEDHNYPPAVVVRLSRLESLRDDMLLEVKGLEATMRDLEARKVDAESVRAQLIPLRAKLGELERMVEQAGAKKKEFDLARVEYMQRATVRNRISERLGAIEMVTAKLRIMHGVPDVARVQMVGRAQAPLEPDSTGE
jgi:hypothetical protein